MCASLALELPVFTNGRKASTFGPAADFDIGDTVKIVRGALAYRKIT